MSSWKRKGLQWLGAACAAAMLCTAMPYTAQAADLEPAAPRFEVTQEQSPMRVRSQMLPDAGDLRDQASELGKAHNQDIAYFDPNVSLGSGVIAFSLASLQQNTVYTQAKQQLRKWREDAYNDARVKFRNDQGSYVTVQQWLCAKNISKDTYLNPSWDNALERIAIQRALETTYTMNHMRTGNESDIWSATVNGIGAYGEVLAFDWGKNFVSAFNMWMGEKDNYIKHVNGANINENDYGHYMGLIDPDANRVGFSMINGAAAGEIHGGNGDTTPLNLNGVYMLPLAVSDKVAANAQFEGLPGHFAVGKVATTSLSIDRRSWNGDAAYFASVDPLIMGEWRTGNANVIAADGFQLKAVGPGTTSIVFDSGTGRNWSGTLTVYRFTDVNTGTPHEGDINWLSDSGITKGYNNSDGTVRYEGMTRVYRQDMAAFLRRLAVRRNISDAATWKPSPADWKVFKDVNRNTPHAEDILWLAHAGISTGWNVAGGKEFRGGSTVVRQDMAAFLRRLADLGGRASGVTPKRDFRDVRFDGPGQTPHAEDIAWLAGSGISEGWKVGDAREFRGMSNVVRQDMAAFLHRLDNLW